MARAAVIAAAGAVTVMAMAAFVKHYSVGQVLLTGALVAAAGGGASLIVQRLERRRRT